MKNPLLLFLLLAVTLPASAQDTSTAGVFKARVINAQTDQPLESVHVIN